MYVRVYGACMVRIRTYTRTMVSRYRITDRGRDDCMGTGYTGTARAGLAGRPRWTRMSENRLIIN